MSHRIPSFLVTLGLLTAAGPALACGGAVEKDMMYGNKAMAGSFPRHGDAVAGRHANAEMLTNKASIGG